MSEWQLIETAPKDGRPLLLWLSEPIDGNQVIGWMPHQEIQAVVGWPVTVYSGRVEWFCGFVEEGTADSDGYTSPVMIGVFPTHWMPLPKPPALTQGARND